MIHRLLNADGDWMFGAGKSSFARDNAAICVNIETTLKTFLGECFYFPTFGQDWFTIINLKNKSTVLLTVKTAIYLCFGVFDVTELEYNYNDDRTFVIKYKISTIYDRNIEGTVSI